MQARLYFPNATLQYQPPSLLVSSSCNLYATFGIIAVLCWISGDAVREAVKYYRVSQKKRTYKTNKNGQTWQACQHSKVVQRGPKGSKMVNLDVFHNSVPFWVHLDTLEPFQTKINLLPHKDKVGFGGGAFEQKNHSSFQMVQRVPDGQKHPG